MCISALMRPSAALWRISFALASWHEPDLSMRPNFDLFPFFASRNSAVKVVQILLLIFVLLEEEHRTMLKLFHLFDGFILAVKKATSFCLQA
jgi:hypothetical protein